MPYKIDNPYQRLPRKKSRRVKIPLSEHASIIEQHFIYAASINGLAKHYGVNKRLIQFILFPNRKEKNLADRAARGGSKIYYNKEKNTIAIRECRRYRQKQIGNKI